MGRRSSELAGASSASGLYEALLLQIWEQAWGSGSPDAAQGRGRQPATAKWPGDFVSHKVRVKDLSGEGRGWGLVLADGPGGAVAEGELLVATRAAATGGGTGDLLEKLLRKSSDSSDPLSMRHLQQLDRLHDGTPRGVLTQQDADLFLLPEEDVAAAMKKTTRDTVNLSRDRLTSMLRLNAYSCEKPKFARKQDSKEQHALFTTLSLMNHSCGMNVSIVHADDCAFVRASRRMPGGTELFSSYVPVFAPEKERNDMLTQIDFPCSCPRCSLERRLMTDAGPTAGAFRSEWKQLVAAVHGARTFTLGGTFAQMLSTLQLRYSRTEAAAGNALCSMEKGPRQEGGSARGSALLDELEAQLGNPKIAGDLASAGPASEASRTAVLGLLGGVAVEACETIAQLSKMARKWPVLLAAQLQVCRVAELISPYSVDHVSWSLRLLEVLREWAEEIGLEAAAASLSSIVSADPSVTKAVSLARRYARHVVRKALGPGPAAWRFIVAAEGLTSEVEHMDDGNCSHDEQSEEELPTEVAAEEDSLPCNSKSGGCCNTCWGQPSLTVDDVAGTVSVVVQLLHVLHQAAAEEVVADLSAKSLSLKYMPALPAAVAMPALSTVLQFSLPWLVDPAASSARWSSRHQRFTVKAQLAAGQALNL